MLLCRELPGVAEALQKTGQSEPIKHAQSLVRPIRSALANLASLAQGLLLTLPNENLLLREYAGDLRRFVKVRRSVR